VLGLFLVYAHLTAIDRALATERDRLRVQADVIAVDMERNLAATNLALDGVIRDHWAGGIASTTPEVASRRLRALVEAVAGVSFMGIYDANGRLIASSRADLTGRDFSHRDYFVSVRDRPDAATLYVAAPFKSVDNRLVTTVSRMLPGPDGNFAGVIVATLDPAYFASVLRPLGYAPDVWSVVIHGDGRQLASFPAVKASDGVDLNRSGTFFRRHIESGQGATVTSGLVSSTDQDRLMALRTVQPARLHMDKAMLVGVGREIGAIEGPLQREAGVYGGLYAVVAILSCGLLYWSQRRRAQIDDLTDERERVREEAAERVQLALRGANLGLWEIDLASGGWVIDESCAAFMGYTVQEIGATPARWLGRMHPQDSEPSAAAFSACVNGDAPFYEFIYRIRHRDGHWVWMQARGQVITRDKQGKALRIMGTVMDITLLRKADAEVLQARNELEAVFDNMTEALLVYDNQRKLLRANQAGRTIHHMFEPNMPMEVMLPLVDLVLPSGEVLAPDQWPSQRAFRGDFLRNYEVQFRRKDNGHSVSVEYNTAPVRNAEGQIELLIIAHRDVTERRVSTALRQSEARFRTLIEDAPLAIAILRAGRIVYSNPRYQTLHGYTRNEQLAGMEWSALVAPESHSMTDARRALIAQDSATELSFEVIGLRKGGRRVQELKTTARVELADGPATLIFAQDISAQKQAEVDLMQARDLAESANRSKAEFLANMSHEIRSPMNVILGLAYLLEKAPLSRDAQDMVRRIRSAGRRLLGIINDILDVSKIEAGRMELEHAPFRLSDVIDNVASTMGMAAGDKNIELVVAQEPVDSCGGSFMGDALRLEQVLVNLTSNAIKFTSTGQVVLRIEVLERQGDRMLMRLSVKDTGIGIAPELQREVFSAFSQADSSTTRKFGGTGLGLTICRQLVTLMGGEIGLDSTPGEGSDFWFKVALQQIPESDFSSPEMARINTLVVDDSSIARDAVVAAARGLGWNVEAFESGEAAVAHLLERVAGRLPDVVVLDWKMPGMDGLDAARAIRAAVPMTQCPIVIMATAYSLSDLSNEPGAEMVDAILSKPVTLSALYNSVLQARRRRAANVGLLAEPEQAETQELLGLRLLVVDDSEINCEVAKRILEEHGAEVQLAFDGSAALDWLMAHPTGVDLVLLDVQMPIMDGLEVTRRLRRLPQFKALPIVALTAGAFKSQQDAAREAGMTDFIGKPFDVPSTVALIQRLAPNRPMGPARASAPDAVALRSAVEVSTERLVMDVGQGLSTWGKLDTYRDYLRRFVAAHGNSAVVIATSLSTGDRAGACALAHKLAGVAANMALPEAYRLAADVERLLTEERDATVSLALLDSALQEACASIERFAPAPGALPAGVQSVAVLDPEALTQVEALLAQLLDALDTDSPVPAEPIISRLAVELPARLLGEISAHLRGFDFRAAETSVSALAHELGITIGGKTL
jgi:PAS domain S-box-containing protein